ncbi:MAG: hypothetical protein ACF8R7_06465 [Phycisphaerales bacterium JB039]
MNARPLHRGKPRTSMLLLSALPAVATAQEYAVTPLGTPTVQSAAMAINESANAAGYDLDLDGQFSAVLWDGAAPTAFAGLPGDSHAHGTAINGAGVAAAMSFSLGRFQTRAMLIAGAAPAPIGAFAPRGVNDAGDVVGSRDVTTAAGWHTTEAVLYSGGALSSLARGAEVSSEATDINNHGVIVGSFIPAGQLRPRPCAWIGGVRHDLGTLGGASALALAISDSGFVVGLSQTASGAVHAFRLTLSAGGAVSDRIDLGELGRGFSYAYAVNDAGVVVGTSDSRAFVWRDGTMTDLNALISPAAGWELFAAAGVNSSGQIVGSGRHDGAQLRAFLLSPDFCYADCDGDGALTLFDFLCFQNAFAFGDPYADCDGSGGLDFFDFLCFQNAFAAGCP